MIANKINLANPYMVFVMNEYAAKAHRTDFIEQVRSKVFDWFQENGRAMKELQELADEEAASMDQAYIASTCDEYELPCLEYNVHAPDYD